MIDWQKKYEGALKKVEMLEDENAVLQMHVDDLKKLFGSEIPIPRVFGLTGKESMLLQILVARPTVKKTDLMSIYEVNYASEEVPEIKIIDVFVCKMRKKLQPFDITIRTHWGNGYFLSTEDREKVKNMASVENGLVA